MKHILTLAALVFATSCFGQVPDYAPSDGLVAWYAMDGNGIDDSPNEFHASNYGATATADRHGNPGSALSYQGAEWMEVSHNEMISFPVGEELTWSLWIKVENETQPQDVLSKWNGSGSTSYSQLMLRLDGVYSGQYLYSQAWCSALQESQSRVSAPTSAGEWCHVVMRSANGQSEFFVNGQSVFLSEISANSGCDNNYSLTIGRRGVTENRFFIGELDELAIWDRYLSESEVIELFLGTPPAFGCSDPSACNYDATANWDDDSCHFNCLFCNDGTVWNEVTQGCDVANPSDTDFDGCVGMTDLLGLLSVFGTCNEIPWSCGDPLEYHGYDYETVLIGEQCWFAENLRTQNYRNGGEIVSGLDEVGWSSVPVGQRTHYGEGSSDCDNYLMEFDGCDETLASEVFGSLYNAHAVLNTQQLCPNQWSVPSEDDWVELKQEILNDAEDFQSLLSDELWSNGSGDNSSGFNALPGGNRYASGWYSNIGAYGCWWTTTTAGANTVKYALIDGSQSMVIFDSDLAYGFSVRCLKDSE